MACFKSHFMNEYQKCSIRVRNYTKYGGVNEAFFFKGVQVITQVFQHAVIILNTY